MCCQACAPFQSYRERIIQSYLATQQFHAQRQEKTFIFSMTTLTAAPRHLGVSPCCIGARRWDQLRAAKAQGCQPAASSVHPPPRMTTPRRFPSPGGSQNADRLPGNPGYGSDLDHHPRSERRGGTQLLHCCSLMPTVLRCCCLFSRAVW